MKKKTFWPFRGSFLKNKKKINKSAKNIPLDTFSHKYGYKTEIVCILITYFKIADLLIFSYFSKKTPGCGGVWSGMG